MIKKMCDSYMGVWYAGWFNKNFIICLFESDFITVYSALITIKAIKLNTSAFAYFIVLYVCFQ